MALSPQLLQFKSSGVYRLEFDKSQTANIDVSTLRLVVGHSRKGPYNTPVLIENVEAFIQVYGNIDKSLEKKGMFFHRSAQAALSRGPILALNLASFGSNDLASAVQISTNGSYGDDQDPVMERPAGNTWVTGDVKVAAVAPAITNTITLASATAAEGQSGQGVRIVGEDLTGSISTNDYVLQSDGTVTQIMTVSFDGADTLIGIVPSSDEFDASYIGSTSFVTYDAGTEQELYSEAEYLADFTIATYPPLGHQTGNYSYASFFDTDKFMVPSDEKVLQTLVADANQVLNFVNIKQTPITVFTRKAQETAGFDVTAREWYGEGNVPAYLNDKDLMSDYMIDVFVFKGKFDAASMDTDPVYGYYFDSKGLRKQLLEQFANLRQVEMIGSYTGSMLPGFKDLEGRNVYIETMINAEARRTGLFCAIDEDSVTDELTETPIDLIGHTFDEAAHDQIVLSYDIQNRTTALPAHLTYSANGTDAVFTYTDVVGFDPLVKKGNYIRSGNRLALVNQVAVAKPVNGEIEVTIKLSEAAPAIAPSAYVESLEDAAVSYTPFVFDGAVIEAETINSCLEAIALGTGLATGLVDKDAIDFRYIVDTFGSFDGQLRNKIQLSQLAKERQNAAAILNAPMVKDFKASTDPSFINAFNGSFQTSYIPNGGNLDLNPTSLYTLPSIADGANYAFYYGPGLIVRENGKDVMVPPAAYVSNNYIDKYTDALPWSIVAGPRRGVVAGTNVAGAEYSFDKADRDILEPFGYNPIVFQRGVGLTILGNKTAQQSIKSSLSSAHVREVLIYIQDAMADILKDYVFEFNNAQTRLEIKTLADSLMESVRQDGGVYDFKNVMDQSNNTGEVIDNNIGIIDTFVEPVKGLEIVVHRTTILNTGEISTGNFS